MTKIKLHIDNQEILAEKGSNLLTVAKQNGIAIPSLCYHRKLSPTGACRLCITKIKGMNGLVASCTVSVTEGMEVIAFDEELENTRRFVLNCLMAEHNFESDGSYNDELQQLFDRYSIQSQLNYNAPEFKNTIPFFKDDSSPILSYDASKCIKCFRCIKACSEVQGKNVLSMADRGINSYIAAGFADWKNYECDGCGECIQLCPTGAIVEKPNRVLVNINKIDKKVRTTCPYCGVGCQLELWVKDNKIVRSNGVENQSPNDGRLCVKGRFGYDFVDSTERLIKPLIKKNGVFEEASWDEALTLIANKFSEIKNKYGGDAFAGYASAKCTNEDNYIFQKFIRIAFGTNNIDYCTRLCHASTVTAMLRSMGDGAASNSIEDFENTDCLFVTGNNMIETHPVTATYVKRGKAKGMKIIVVDPKWTPMVKYADVWLQPRLGTDVALLNGIVHILINENLVDYDFIEKQVEGGLQAFYELKNIVQKYTPERVEEITSVSAEKLILAANIYGRAHTAMIATGMGMSQQVTGTNNVFALINMMLITGNIGKDLCGLNPPRGQNNVQGATDVGCSPIYYPGYIPASNDKNRKKVADVWGIDIEKLSGKPGLTTIEIVKAAHEGKIKAMYIMGENPMLTDPNLNHTKEAFEKLDFLVVQDIFHTETTPYADVILPAASFAEKNGTFVNSDRRVLRVRKAVESPGEARNDWEIITQIANKMNINLGNFKNESEIFNEIANVTPMLAGISFKRLEKHGIQWPCTYKTHKGTGTMYTKSFNTTNGKAKIFPVEYAEQIERSSLEYPFILNSGRILYQYHSSTMSRKNKSLNDFADQHYVLINPIDAVKSAITEGEKIILESKQGKLETFAKISYEVAEGELFMPWHFQESLVNSLTRDNLDPLSKIAPFKLTACKILKKVN